MPRRWLVITSAVFSIALLGATAGQSGTSAGQTIKIGIVADKSGPIVASFAPVLHGMNAYFRMVNDSGGINGDKLEIIERDDQYNVAKGLEAVKDLVYNEKVALVTGISNSSGYPTILPILNAAKVPGLSNAGSVKLLSWPFQPWMFQGICNYSDQADVALGYSMTRLKLKDLRGKKVGIAGIGVASGQEWIETLSANVTKLGGTPVVQQMPPVIVNADVQVLAFVDQKVDFILMHHAVSGGVAMLKSMAKFGLNVPISGSYSVTQDIVFTSSPYDAAKFFVGTNCYSPPPTLKSPQARLAVATGAKYGYPAAEIAQPSWANGWVNAMVIVEGLKNAKGKYDGPSVRAGLEKVKNLETGGLSPNVTLSPKCHMLMRQVRPYSYSFNRKAMVQIGTYSQWSKFITNAQAAPGTCGKPRGAK